MRVTRRDLFKLGAAGAWGGLVIARARPAGAALPTPYPNGTTLRSRIARDGARTRVGARGTYYGLKEVPSDEPIHLRREDLAARASSRVGTSLLHFVHLTDIHVIDAQSPARVEFLDRHSEPACPDAFSSAYRPQEALTVQVLEAMLRRIRSLSGSPVTGAPIGFAICTGDNIDNEQLNELRWFIDTMDGGTVTPNSGAAGSYEGVQSASWADGEYWHPDAGVPDKYKRQWGFPDVPGLLAQAVQPFAATGSSVPWYQTFGNHDGLMQGNAPRQEVFEAIAVGPLKVTGPPPGIDPCDSFDILRNDPEAFLRAPARPVTPDPARRIVRRREYVDEHFVTRPPALGGPGPVGHGFTRANRTDGTAYYTIDDHPMFRLIVLDTVNPGGFAEGSIGTAQLAWLEARLAEVHSAHLDARGGGVRTSNADRLVMLFSHHGLRSLDNPVIAPDPREPEANDLPRVLADDVRALVHRFPNVIAWVNGHTHDNIVEPRRAPGGAGGFWDIGTAAHVDWNCQSRLIEVLSNDDGTISIVCTMIDHAAPADPASTSEPVLRLASIARELTANDPQKGITRGGAGQADDRNLELVIRAPFALPQGLRASSVLWIPRSPLEAAAALATVGTAAIVRRRLARAGR